MMPYSQEPRIPEREPILHEALENVATTDGKTELRDRSRSFLHEIEDKDLSDFPDLYRWILDSVQAGEGCSEQVLENLREELRFRLLNNRVSTERFRLSLGTVALDLLLLGRCLDSEAKNSGAVTGPEARAKTLWDDFVSARREATPGIGVFDRMQAVIGLTGAYLHYEGLPGTWERDLELRGLEERRSLEKLAYETIADVTVMAGKQSRLSSACSEEVARDLKVIYHQAFDAGSLSTLALLGNRGGVQQILELSAGAEALRSEAAARPAAEGLFRLLEAAELYGRLGLDLKISRCLEQARKLAPQLPAADRSAAYLRIDQISRRPAVFSVGSSS